MNFRLAREVTLKGDEGISLNAFLNIYRGAVRRVRLRRKADPPVSNSRRKRRRDVDTNNVILMDLIAIH